MNNNRCICCNEIIPSGRQVCWICEHLTQEKEDKDDAGVFERTKDEVREDV